jgi:hypothetical protein
MMRDTSMSHLSSVSLVEEVRNCPASVRETRELISPDYSTYHSFWVRRQARTGVDVGDISFPDDYED